MKRQLPEGVKAVEFRHSSLRTASAHRGRAGFCCALLAAMLSAQPAAAQLQVDNGCMEAVYQAYNGGGTLNCVANDVKVAGVTNVTILDDGCQFIGDTVTFSADYEILMTAQARYDIGIYFSTDGSDAVLGSSCTIVTLPDTITDLDGTADDTNTNDAYGYCSPDGGTTQTIGGDACHYPVMRMVLRIAPLATPAKNSDPASRTPVATSTTLPTRSSSMAS